MIRILVTTIAHTSQRYDTVGDYFEADYGRALAFKISRMADWRSEAAVFLHEFVEAMLCQRARISIETIDAFDMGPGAALEEPGDAPDCPYRNQHQIAEVIERFMVVQLGMSWAEHEENVRRAGETTGSGQPPGEDRSLRQGGRGVPGEPDRGLPDQERGEGTGNRDRAVEEDRAR